jgi:hypothetical protein
MFASSHVSRAGRRGIVLVVVLAVLGLLALIGVTFATFASQAQVSARNRAAAAAFPDASEVMDFALSQLIDDTANPQSVLRGHSLKRDMYGNDAYTNGPVISAVPGTGQPMYIHGQGTYDNGQPPTVMTSGQYAGLVRCYTTIPSNNSANSSGLYGYDFTRWILRFPPNQADPTVNYTNTGTNSVSFVSHTYEVVVDDATSDPNWRIFYLAAPGPSVTALLAKSPAATKLAKSPPDDPTITGFLSPELPAPVAGSWTSTLWPLTLSTLSIPFTLDGRYLRAYNGSGVSGMNAAGLDTAGSDLNGGHPLSELANFRYNGNIFNNVTTGAAAGAFAPALGDPSAIPVGMDEDYDACDLENWFLAIQSADGQVVIPSFHRPAILAVNANNPADNDWTRTFNPADTSTGDTLVRHQLLATRAMSRILRPRAADGHSPVAFPDLVPDATTGKITFDVDNDADGVTDSVWLDLGYPAKQSPNGPVYKPLFAFLVIGLNGRLPLNTAGNLQKRDDNLNPLYDHAEHLGNSPSEIDLRYALQNAYDPANPNSYHQLDNSTAPAGVTTNEVFPIPAWRTQLRNLLAGTRPFDASGVAANGDLNTVVVNGHPYHLPNGVGDTADNATGAGSPTVLQPTDSVPGRWGEEAAVPGVSQNPIQMGVYANAIRAGRSVTVGGSRVDAFDDNYTTFDFWPALPLYSPGRPESNGNNPLYPADYYDASGSINLPVERTRRFVTPVDAAGDGRLITYNTYNPTGGTYGLLGADPFGRVSFFRYFRPPGMPMPTFSANGTTVPNQPAPLSLPATAGPAAHWYLANGYDIRTNNLYHGYAASLMPPVATSTANAGPGLALAGMPTDLTSAGASLTPPPYITTISDTTARVATFQIPNAAHPDWINSNPYFVSPGLNEADEMDLYNPSTADNPFGPADLEWLYRLHDTDGAQLHSRLAQLAPVSFLNLRDGLRRRRLFALDSWETTNFVWANDNPQGAFPNNSRFKPSANASFASLNFNVPYSANVAGPLLYNGAALPNPVNPDPSANPHVPSPDPASDFAAQSASTFRYPVPTPSLAHRDRRVNLNFPLPVSNSPVEPVRQKWVRETYALLKAVLPPKAVDTPEELAQLSQYLVNVVDFRDPDCTMTKFVNTDVVVVPPTATTPATLNFSAVVTTPGNPSVAYDSANITPNYNAGTNEYLIQYGMEYQPVAINEVLALRFETNINDPTSAPPGNPPTTANLNYVTGIYVELVNTLTKTAAAGSPDMSDLDLAGWDAVIMQDDGLGRPNPYNGQIPDQAAANIKAFTLTGKGAAGVIAANTAVTGLTTPLPALPTASTVATPSNNYYVLGGLSGAAKSGTAMSPAPPTAPATTADLAKQLAGLKENQYYWLYLRRPPNPFDPQYDTNGPNDNRVVVDCFRFVYSTSTGTAYTYIDPTQGKIAKNGVDPTSNKEAMFSLQRLQPYRGGHAVPPLAGVSGKTVVPAYGYSEQTAVSSTQSATKGNYTVVAQKTTSVPTTAPIYHTLGAANAVTGGNSTTLADLWDYPPFNDRDFTSVAELLMVPGCPPGLFTKQFAEAAPPIAGTTPVLVPTPTGWTPSPWWTTPTGTPPTGQVVPTLFLANAAPHTFPYLNDEFFYTGASEPTPPSATHTATAGSGNGWVSTETALTAANPTTVQTTVPYRSAYADGYPADTTHTYNYVGGPGGAGWFKMFDFLEVPTTSGRAVGPASQGVNYDWARQDTRPGLLNLNLIIDEEVFVGLMGENLYLNHLNRGLIGLPNNTGVAYGSTAYAQAKTPAVVTQVDDNGNPTHSYHMPNVGIYDPNTFVDPVDGTTYGGSGSAWNGAMKASFADFLSLRHGGTGFIYAGAAERPFRSLSFPDIDYTVLRPAALPPATSVLYPPQPVTGSRYPFAVTPDNTTTFFTDDPGVKNPFLFTSTGPAQPPPVPPRRLFGIADAFGSPNGVTVPVTTPPTYASNASVPGAKNVNQQVPLSAGLAIINPGSGAGFATAYPDLNQETRTGTVSHYLGGAVAVGTQPDQTQHPYFRSEWLQKVTNLTTVRTHQYAVWVTVGFFEVTRQGDPALALSPSRFALDASGNVYDAACDQLGLELGAVEGKTQRYRGFFLLDRTRAVGFNPQSPGDFRDVVVHRQLIE